MNTSFEAACESARERWKVPALAVGTVVSGRERVVALGCEPDTRFRIASITKPLVATLALSLLDLDEPTGIWPDDVRVRHLLAHTSGYDCELADTNYPRFGTGEDALARCVAELPAVRRFFAVEEVWSYANTGYWLAGHLAAQRAGTTFEAALGERVLAPAGLEATSFDEPDLPGSGRDLPPAPYPRARRPSGGLTSTVGDLLRFGRWHLADPASGRMRVVAGKPVGGVYGLGLAGERVGGTGVWGHPGAYGGFESSFLTVPDRDAIFVGLTNSEGGGKALRLIEDAWLQEAVGAGRRLAATVDLTDAALAAFAGRYATPEGPAEVESAAGGLVVRLPDGRSHVTHAVGERTFEVTAGEYAGERFDFPRPGYARFGSRVSERL